MTTYFDQPIRLDVEYEYDLDNIGKWRTQSEGDY